MSERRAEKRARGAEHRRRLTTCLAKLAWLEGFPLAGGWYRLDRDEPIALDGALIARSRRAARTALREHRAALGELVGDVDHWWAVVDAALAWCSAPRGELDLLDHAPRRIASRARKLAARDSLRAAVIAAGVAWATRPQRLGDAIAWLAVRDAIVEDVATTLALARLASDSLDGVAALLALLAIDAPHPTTAVRHVVNLRARLRGSHADATPPGRRSSHHVRAWLASLRRRSSEAQHRALDLLAVSGIAEALAPWCTWERANADRLARAAAFVARDAADDELGHNQQRLHNIVDDIAEAAPRNPILIDEVLAEIDAFASVAKPEFHAAAVRLLTAYVGEHPGDATRLLLHVSRVARRAAHDRVVWLWEALAAARDAGASPRIFDPWRAVLRRGGSLYLEDDLVEHLVRRAEVDRLVDTLAALAAQGPMSPLDADRAAAWIAAGLARDAATEVVVALRDVDGHVTPELARAVVALSDGTARDIVAQAPPVLQALAELEYAQIRSLLRLVEHAAHAGAAWIVRAAFAASQSKALAEAAELLDHVPRMQWPAIPTPRRPAWLARFPDPLAAALVHLAAVDPDAEQTAARRLATDLPHPDELRREIAALRERAPLGNAQAKRLANLEQRVATPRQPSAARLANLADKLERTAVSIGVRRICERIAAAATERLKRSFPHGGWPDLIDRQTREIVYGLLALPEPDRVLAGRLLRARTGARPWDLRDERPNAAFLAAMRAAGLDPAPWLDDTPTSVIAKDGRAVELALCSDPIEVFAMGAHFSTCLAPGDINYFSVVANAADINKRVLYARRDGGVIGRCLLAVTDGFALLTFNPYCHDGALGFVDIVRTFALELAARMGTRVVARGAVRTLLAREWYDDGPIDLVGRFVGLDQTAIDLEQVEPGALVERLRAALDHDIDDVTLPLVLALPALHSRPALVVPLAPYIMASHSSATHIAGAALAADASDTALADRLLGDHADAISLVHNAWFLGQLLARLRPSYTLVRLRASRGRGVRTWRDERSDRVAVAALAMATLNRPHKAAELYQQAIDDDPDLAEELRPQLAALRARITAPAPVGATGSQRP